MFPTFGHLVMPVYLQDAQEFLRCIMDQLHEELKQPVFSLPVEQLSETQEPIHQAKRLLGGTSSPIRDLDEGMYLRLKKLFIGLKDC